MDEQAVLFTTNIFIAITGAVLIPLLLAWLYVVRVNRKREWLQANGRSVPVKIIKFIPNGRGIGTGDKKIQGVVFILEVQPEGEQPYQVTHREQLRVIDIIRFSYFNTLTVRFTS